MKLKPLIFFFSLIVIIFHCNINAQSLSISTNQDPPSTKWKCIESKHFIVIYPEQLKDDAVKAINTLEYLYPLERKTLSVPDKKLRVILRANYSEANGFATLAPRRSEWYNTPPQGSFNGTNPWYPTLAVHEYRHICQFDSLNIRTTRLLSILLGEHGQLAGSFVTVPGWFFEGDAVATETALTNSGRGRLPMFDAELRALLLNGKRYSYDKALFGSYADWDPLQSPYLMGYYMTSNLRRSNGPDIFKKVNATSAIIPLVPYWYSASLNINAGLNVTQLYNRTFDEMTALWKKQLDELTITSVNTITKLDRKNWTYNNSIQQINDDQIIFERYGFSVYPQEVVAKSLSTGKEKVLFQRQRGDIPVSSNNGNFVWEETVPDLRWGVTSYSVIRYYSSSNNKIRSLTTKSKLFAPAISPDGNKIAAVEFDNMNRCSLVILDINGKILKKIPSTGNEFLQLPSWLPDNNQVVCTKLSSTRGKGIYLADTNTGNFTEVIPYTNVNTMNPVSDGEYIYYVASYTGIDNIYAVNIKSKKIFQVTSRPYGVYQPSVSRFSKKIFFSDLTQYGRQGVSIDINPQEWIPLEKVADNTIKYYAPLVEQEGNTNFIENIPTTPYEEKNYSQARDFLPTLHSWGPPGLPNLPNGDLTFSIFNTSLLSTFASEISYNYNWYNSTHGGSASLLYAGLFPIFKISGIYGEYASSATNQFNRQQRYTWMQKTGSLSAIIPLNLSSSYYDRFLQIAASAEFTNISNKEISTTGEGVQNNGNLIPLSIALIFSNGYSTPRSITPVFGQHITATFSIAPFKTPYKGYMAGLDTTWFFPGLLPDATFYINLAGEYTQSETYEFPHIIELPRGYAYVSHEYLGKATANYTLPLFNPDLSILRLMYIKRFYTNVFFDYMAGFDSKRRTDYMSAGIELSSEFYVFRLPVPLNLGIRYAYLLKTYPGNNKQHTIAPIFGINFSF